MIEPITNSLDSLSSRNSFRCNILVGCAHNLSDIKSEGFENDTMVTGSIKAHWCTDKESTMIYCRKSPFIEMLCNSTSHIKHVKTSKQTMLV